MLFKCVIVTNLQANMKFSINEINKRNREVNELKSLMGNVRLSA